MKQSQVTIETIIAPKGVERIRAGHLWVFRSDVIQAPHIADSGSITRVVNQRNRFVAWALFGAESEITLRVISKTDYAESKTTPEFWREFWRERLLAAYEWRKRVVGKAEAYRLGSLPSHTTPSKNFVVRIGSRGTLAFTMPAACLYSSIWFTFFATAR